ncbi:type VI secretion system spike protein VgrG1b [soil metagenome]
MPMQKERELELFSSLGEEALLLDSFSYSEELGMPYALTIGVRLGKPDADPYDTLGKMLNVRIRQLNKEDRHLHAMVRAVQEPGAAKGARIFMLTCVPKLWALSVMADCKIFQNKTVPDIIKAVLGDADIAVESRLEGTYRKWLYCVQYRESDLQFITRLMEQEGITYFFVHSDDDAEMILVDSTGGHQAIPGYTDLEYHDPDSKLVHDALNDWRQSVALQSERVGLRDYDFKAPSKNLEKIKKLDFKHVIKNTEMFDYPGEYWQAGEGAQAAQVKAEQLAAHAQVFSGEGPWRGAQVGGTFALKDPTNALRAGLTEKYMVTAMTMTGANDEFSSGKPGGAHVRTSISAIPATRPFRPRQRTPRPIIAGPQTAEVVGPSGEEIHTDEHGRVKVQFHWDREGKKDENSSCWVRVSQYAAGSGRGSISIPRVGDEVIVEFAEGDPDRPIITGRLYNGTNKPPFALPGSKNVEGSKTSSSKGGGGHNEMSLDDSKGKEKINIHGQYDMATTVKHDQTNTIQNDQKDDVTNNRTTKVGVDDAETIGSNQKVEVGAKQTVKTGADQEVTVGANQIVKVASNTEHSSGANNTTKATGKFTMSSGGPMKIDAGAKMEISAAAALDISAAKITLKAGGSTIEIGPGGIKITSGAPIDIKGAVVKVNS